MLSHFTCLQLFGTPWTVAHQVPLSMESSGKNTGVGFHALLQGIFPTQGSNLGLLHCSQILYYVSHQGSPNIPNCCCLVTHRVQLFATPNTAACQVSLSFTISWSLLKLMSIESMMPSRCLVLCHPLFLLPSIFPSIRVFSNESFICIRWPNYWCFSFTISPSSEYSGLICFRIAFTGWISLQFKRLSTERLSSLTPQFKSINSLVLSLLHSPTLTSIHGYWKNHSFD